MIQFKTTRKGIKILLAVFIILTVYSMGIMAWEEEKKVLILNSYHQDFSWTNEETQGIMEGLKLRDGNINIAVEYMDWKRYPTNENLRYLYDYLKYKYQETDLDVLVVTDDTALAFALIYQEDIFNNAPIVFCGVDEEGIARLVDNPKQVTGVTENIDLAQTVNMAININPDLAYFYIIHDQSESGISSGKIAADAIRNNNQNIKIRFMTNQSHGEIIEQLEALPPNSAILITSYYMDSTGNMIEFEAFTRIVSDISPVPVFHMYDVAMGAGAIGGSMVSGRMQGILAADLANQILSGTSVEAIDIITEYTQRTVFDYEQLMRYHIPIERIPKDSEMINQPFSFFETYKILVLTVLFIVAMLIIFIVILLGYIRKVRAVKKELQLNHEELTQTYEELTASDEELIQQMDEISAIKESLVVSEERYRLIFDATNDAILDWDVVESQVFFSDRWKEIIGYSIDEFREDGFWERFVHPNHEEELGALIYQGNLLGREHFIGEYQLKTKEGLYKWFLIRGKTLYSQDNTPYRAVYTFTDIDKLILMQEELKQLAYHDSLTGLHNKVALKEKIASAIDDTEKPFRGALVFVDTDNFKLINDSMGHSFGDLFIQAIGKRLQQLLSDPSNVFRIGGDEFILLLEDMEEDEIKGKLDSIMDAFQIPFIIQDMVLHTTISIGVAIYRYHGDSFEELLKNADIAMYRAKAAGKARYVIFHTQMNEAIKKRIEIENYLRAAIDREEFVLYYQPQYNIKTRQISGFEALVRWNSRELGFVQPNQFIQIAEDSHLIIPLGRWILKEACKFIQTINITGHQEKAVSVNISLIQLMQDNFVEMVLSLLHEYELSPSSLVLEITESILIESFEQVVEKLERLRNHNVGIALDDFGTGYSSLSYLRQLPITTLKIDKSFVDNVSRTGNHKNIVSALINLGHNMKLEVVAEGVETTEEFGWLEQHKCDVVQGYLLGKPLPQNEAFLLLATDTTIQL